MLSVPSASTMNLALFDAPNVGWRSVDVPASAVPLTVNLTFASPLPVPLAGEKLSYLAWLVPVDAATLKASSGAAAAAIASSGTFQGLPSTRFTDRFLLHPDAVVPAAAALPVRALTACGTGRGSGMNASPLVLQCTLPPNATGALWRVAVDWVVTFAVRVSPECDAYATLHLVGDLIGPSCVDCVLLSCGRMVRGGCGARRRWRRWSVPLATRCSCLFPWPR